MKNKKNKKDDRHSITVYFTLEEWYKVFKKMPGIGVKKSTWLKALILERLDIKVKR